jgi:tRNA C32,U32 (ribose-2'-O)-methylase TrmJ
MTKSKTLEKKLTALLREAERTREQTLGAIRVLRRIIETTENKDEAYQKRLRQTLHEWQSVVRASESEAAALRQILHQLRQSAREAANGNAPPPMPTTIRVIVSKNVQISDDEIVKLVLRKLNLNGYAKETQA